MRILGVDPGSRKTGFGVLTIEKNGQVTVNHFGVVRPKVKGTLEDRLLSIHDELSKIIATYKPQAMAVEEVFFAKDAKSALVLGHARGVILLAGKMQQLGIFPYSARTVKLAITGSGRADKTQVSRMICQLLHLTSAVPEDAADALAVALCHANSYRMETYDRISRRKTLAPRR